MDAILLDSNVLIYAIDPRDLLKQERALAVLAALQATRKGCLSVQCLSEFSAVCIRSMKALSSEDFNPGVYAGVRVTNPFAAAFDLQAWL